MSVKLIGGLVAALLILGGLITLGAHNSNVLSSHLPPLPIKYSSREAATQAGFDYSVAHAKGHAVQLLPSTGTPSMEPYINGTNYLMVIDESIAFESINKYDYIAFHAAWLGANPAANVVGHVVAEIESGGLVTEGIHNPSIDSGEVTKSNYIGKIIFVVSW